MKTFNRFLSLAVVLCIVSLGATQALAATYYSTGSADLATLSNWNSNRDGVSGSAPANFITAGDVFVIQGTGNGGTTPHAMTLAGVLTIGSGASNTKLQIENGASLTATAALTFGSVGIFQIDNGGTYNHNNAGALGTALFAGVESFGPSSNFVIGGTTSPGTGPSTASFTGSFGNFTFSTTSATTMQCNDVMPNVAGNFTKSGTPEFRMAASTPVNGGFTIGGDFNLSAGIFSFGNGSVVPNLTVSGNFNMTGGTLQTAPTVNPATNTLTLNKAGIATFTKSAGTITAASSSGRHISVVVANGTTLDMGTSILNCAGSTNLDFTVSSGATVRLGDPGGIVAQGTSAATGNIQTSSTSVRSFSTTGNYQYTGVAAQITGTGLPTTVNNFTVNNSAGVTQTSNLTVNGTLTLTSGTLSPSANTLTANGAVTRTTGYVNGSLSRAVGSGGTPTVDYFVGTGAQYTPVSVAFTSTITGAGTLTASSTGSEHSSIGTSGLDGSKDINRFFSVTNSGITPTNYDVTLNWDAADVDGGATPANFVVKKYDTGVWTSPVSSSNQTSTSIKGNGFSSFSEFAVGETSAPPSDAPVVSAPIGEGATTVSGTSTEGDGTTILIYIDNVLIDSTTVSSNAWTKTGLTALTAGQTVKAKARAAGESESPFSNTVTVQAFTTAPVVSAPISTGATSASGTSSEADGTSIDVYVDGGSVGTTTVSSGAWTKTGLTALTLGQQVKAKATAAGKLESGFSNTVTVTNVLSISTSSPLPNATAGSAYSTTLTAAGGTAPYGNWTVVSGSLPPSMSLNLSTGEISGTSLVAGVYNFTAQVKDALSDSVSKAFQLTVDPGSLDHFSFASISSPQTAGTSFGITITAQDVNNNTVTAFTGTVPLSTTAGSITPSVSGNFTLGVRNENVTVTQAGTGKTITADDGASHTGTSNTFDVDAGALHHFGLSSISSPQIAGTSFGITITAQDLNNNTVTGFAGTVTLSTTAGTIAPTTSGSFSLGVRGETVSVTQSGAGKTISVDDGASHTGTSNAFTVNPGAVDHFSIATITSPKTQNVAFNLVMTAQDLNNNTATAFTGTVSIALSTGTIAPLTSAAFVAGARTEPVTVSTTGTGLTINVDDGATHIGTSNSFDVNAPAPFRSVATGNWNSTGTWETFDGLNWVAAASTPTASEGSITIRSPHTVTVSASVSADEMTIDAGGTVAVDTLITFTIANGTGTDLDVNGSIRNKGTITLSSGNVVNFNNGSYYEHKLQSAGVPKSAAGITVTWAPNSTIEVTGPTGTAGLSGMFTTVPPNADWGNIIWNTTGFTGTGNFNFGGNLTSIKGNFTMASTGSGPALFRFLASGNTATAVTISGNLIITGGTLQFGGGNVANAGSSLNIGGNWNQTAGTFAANVTAAVSLPINFTGSGKTFTQSGGTLTNTSINWFVKSGASLTLNNNIALANSRGDTVENGGTLNCGTNTISGGTGTSFVLQSGGTLGVGSTAGITAAAASGNIQTATRSYNTGGNYTYNGGAAQVTGDGLPATVNNLTINNASGVTLTANATVNGTLAFSNGLLTTGANTATLSTTGTSTGAGSGKYVHGNLARVVPASGSPTFGFDIGDATTYAPVSIAFNTLSSGGTISSNTTAGDHASLGSSGIWSSKSVNRYWTLTNSTAAFTSYDATFNFANPGDLDGGANPGVFQIEKYDGGWTNLAVGTRTSTSTQATGVTSFSDFAIGEALPAGSFYVSPLSLSYGNVITGNSKEDSVYVKNLGPGILHVTSITSTNADFSVTPASDTIAVDDSAWVKVTYTPSADGADAGDIIFVHDGGGSPDTVTFTGTGYTPAPLFSVAPASLGFGTVNVGNSKLDSSYVVNGGTSTLHIASVASDNGLFAVSMPQDSVEAGDTVKVYVTFTPLANGIQNGNVVFTHDATGSPDTLTVSGTGLILAPVFSVNPSSVNFGSVLTGSSKPESVYVKNTGTSALTVSTVTSDNAVFTFTPASAVVSPGDSAKLKITYSPVSVGASSGNIVLTHDATGSPDTVTVSGVGISGATTILSNGTGGGSWTIGSTWQGGIAPSSIDSVVILGSDSVYVLSGSTSSGLYVQAGGKLSLNAKLVPTNFVLNGKAVVYADTLQPSGSVSVGGAGVYQHARDGGRILRGAWADGSTLMITGAGTITNVGGAPGQSYYNIVWNSPAQVANIHMGMHPPAQGDTTTTVRGDITILSTGAGRAQLAAPAAGIALTHTISRINITGNVTVSGTSQFSSHGTSSAFTDIIVSQTGNINVTGGNFSVSRGSQAGTGTTIWYMHAGNFSMSGATTQNSTTLAGGGKFVFDKFGTQTLTLGSGNTMTALPIEVSVGTIFDMGVSQIRGSGLFTLNAGATLRTANAGGLDSAVSITGTKTYNPLASFAFNGAVPQVSGKSLPIAMSVLTMNNASGLSLDTTTTVSGALTLTSGKIITGPYLLAMGPGATVNRTSGHVVGTLLKNVSAGLAVSRTYEIGDTGAYTPVTITFASVGSPGSLAAASHGGEHPNLGTSNIDPAKAVNRYWTMVNSGIFFTSYDGVFNFVAGDVDGGAVPSSFIGQKYDGGWTNLTEGTRTATSTQILGATSFSDFAFGDTLINSYDIVASSGPNGTIIPSGTVTVGDGANPDFIFSAAIGYHVDSIYVDGGYAGDSVHYQFFNVLAPHTIHVTFALNQYTLSVNVVGSGSVAKDPDQLTYAHGSSVDLTATPAFASLFTGWSGDASGVVNPLSVLMNGNKTITATFGDDPLYQVSYRSFSPDSIALDKDNVGKVGKYVKRKANKVYFKFALNPPDTTKNLGLTLKFGMLTSGAVTRGTAKLETVYTWTNLKEIAISLDTNSTNYQVDGVGFKGKAVKVSYIWATTPKTTRGTIISYLLNQPKLPMPNRVNALLETYEQGAFVSTTGLPVGLLRSDSAKFYAWYRAPKYTDVLKTLSDKTGRHNLGTPKFLAYYDNTKIMKGLLKTLPPLKQNNGLLANLVTLKVNIAASQLGKTPVGYGELIYNGPADSTAVFNGMKITDIAAHADSVITGRYVGTVHTGNLSDLGPVNAVIRKLNDAFEGPIDTVDFTTKLHFKGARKLVDVPYLVVDPTITPTIIAATTNPIVQVPDAYALNQNYPNPFNPTTTISFDLPEQAFVTLKVFNMLGQEVATLVDNQPMDDGTQEFQFDASNLSSGVYFYRIIAQGFDDDGVNTTSFITSKKMLLVK